MRGFLQRCKLSGVGELATLIMIREIFQLEYRLQGYASAELLQNE